MTKGKFFRDGKWEKTTNLSIILKDIAKSSFVSKRSYQVCNFGGRVGSEKVYRGTQIFKTLDLRFKYWKCKNFLEGFVRIGRSNIQEPVISLLEYENSNKL